MEARNTYFGWAAEDRSKLEGGAKLSNIAFRPGMDQPSVFEMRYLLNLLKECLLSDYKTETGIDLVFLECYIEKSCLYIFCFSLENWVKIGVTSDGRQVFILALVDNFWEKIHSSRTLGMSPLTMSEAISSEFMSDIIKDKNLLNDKRLSARYSKILYDLLENPDSKYYKAVNGKDKDIAAELKFLNNKNVTFDKILEVSSIYAKRLAHNYDTLLCISDWCDINLNWKKTCTHFLGDIGENQNSVSKGFRLHTLLLSNEYGDILGVLDADLLAVKYHCEDKKTEENKLTNIWKKHFSTTCDLKKQGNRFYYFLLEKPIFLIYFVIFL